MIGSVIAAVGVILLGKAIPQLPNGNATIFLLGPPLVLYVLWRKPAREVFSREYREKVVPMTTGPH